jgi:nicotinate-nucleotide adenylyltransferase
VRIGLYGGCFNPVHEGHIAVARGAQKALQLDQVIFIPSGHPPLKGNYGLADGFHRAAMLERAISNQPGMSVSNIELDRDGPSFTVDTVRTLRKTFQADAEFFFLLGDDCIKRLPHWKGIEELHQLLRFAILPRLEITLDIHDKNMIFINIPRVAVSSTQIRETLASGKRPPAALLHPDVAEYIDRHHLFTKHPERARVQT